MANVKMYRSKHLCEVISYKSTHNITINNYFLINQSLESEDFFTVMVTTKLGLGIFLILTTPKSSIGRNNSNKFQ